MEVSVSQKIFIGEYEVLSSGSLIVPSSKNIEFIFDNLKFRIVFETEKDDNGNLTQGHFDFNVEKDSMLQVATLNKRKLYLKFCINSINNTQSNESKEDKIFYYTWLLEKIIDSTK